LARTLLDKKIILGLVFSFPHKAFFLVNSSILDFDFIAGLWKTVGAWRQLPNRPEESTRAGWGEAIKKG